jgi:hypothetical protein
MWIFHTRESRVRARGLQVCCEPRALKFRPDPRFYRRGEHEN